MKEQWEHIEDYEARLAHKIAAELADDPSDPTPQDEPQDEPGNLWCEGAWRVV